MYDLVKEKKISSLLLTAALFPHCYYGDSFGKEPFDLAVVVTRLSREDQTCKDIFFRSTDVLWRVDRRAGTIVALNPNRLLPLWSSSGIVYQASTTTPPILTLNGVSPSLSTNSSDNPVFDKRLECTEILGRVYFHISERNAVVPKISDSNPYSKSENYIDQILAFDVKSQGKLLWKLSANELKRILAINSTAVPRFASVPLKGSENQLIVVLVLDAQIVSLKIDSRSGVLIR